MQPPSSENCVICRKYRDWLKNANSLPPRFRDEFYCMMRIKTFENGQKTPILTTAVWEAKIHYCPRCGALWSTPRRKLPKE